MYGRPGIDTNHDTRHGHVCGGRVGFARPHCCPACPVGGDQDAPGLLKLPRKTRRYHSDRDVCVGQVGRVSPLPDARWRKCSDFKR